MVISSRFLVHRMFKFEELDVYQKAIHFTNEIFELTNKFPKSQFVLVDQLRRASLSIALNIAKVLLVQKENSEDSSIFQEVPVMSAFQF